MNRKGKGQILSAAGHPVLALLAPPDAGELDMATVEELHAAQTRIETKVDHVLERLATLAGTDEKQFDEIRELRDRVIVLEERQRHEVEADEKAEQAERWATVEKWLVRVGATVGGLGATASATGLI